MELLVQEDLPGLDEKKPKERRIVLSSRDFEIIEFILDMKFASCEEIFERFFKVTLSNEPAKSDLWAKKRLLQLEQGMFLRSVRSFSESTRYFTATLKSYHTLNQVLTDKFIAKPIGGFDQRTFIHDKTVLKLRLFIESSLPSANWISERKLKSSTELACGLNSTDIPDGVFMHPTLGRVAFELEIAHKNQSRYQKKVKRYVHLMRSRDIPNKFNCVIFVCLKETVRARLKKETGIYGSMFKVLSVEEFQSEIKGISNEKQHSIVET